MKMILRNMIHPWPDGGAFSGGPRDHCWSHGLGQPAPLLLWRMEFLLVAK